EVDVTGAGQEYAFAHLAIPSGTADFLIVALDISRQIMVDDEADVGLIDPHTESICGNGNLSGAQYELPLVGVALLFAKPAVVYDIIHTIVTEEYRNLLLFRPCSCIDVPGFPGAVLYI